MNALQTKIIEHPFLNTMLPEHRNLLSKNAQEVTLRAGEVLFNEGEPANRLFLIQNGCIALETGRNGESTTVQTLKSGEVLGWSWLFPPFSWHFTARALEQTRLIVLDGAHLLVNAEEDPRFGYELMKRITKLVIHRLEAERSCLCK